MQGANLALLEMVLELKSGYYVEPVVLMPRIHRNYAEYNLMLACQQNHIDCFSYPFYRFHNSTRWVQYVRCFSNLLCYPYVYLRMRKQHFDIIHSNGSVLSLGAFLSRLTNTPHVWHLREASALHYGTKSLPGKAYEKWVYKHGDLFIAISNALKAYYAPLVPEDKIKLIYDGVRRPCSDTVVNRNHDVFKFCMVGLVSPPKNQLDALKAVSILVNEWHVTGLHLTIIGFEEPVYVQRLRFFVQNEGLGKYVTFLGERSDVYTLLSDMNVGLMLSKFEAFGRVTVEYMMQGLAVIASDSGANGEIVENERTGLLYRLGDCRELAQHMLTLMENPDKLHEFSEKGRQRALELFTSERNTKQVYEAYMSILSSEEISGAK